MRVIVTALSILVLGVVIQGAPGIRRGSHRPRLCRMTNLTSSEVLCSETCPEFTTCSNLPADANPKLDASIEIQVCIAQSCETTSTCPSGTTCRQVRDGNRCIPDATPAGPQRLAQAGQDSSSCRQIMMKILREKGNGHPSRPGRHPRRPHPRLCKLTNTTSNEVLCSDTQACPNFTDCQKPALMRQRLSRLSVEVNLCIPKICGTGSPPCPTGSSCKQLQSESRCLPNDQNLPPQEEMQNREQGKCGNVLQEILEANRPIGQGPGSPGRQNPRERGGQNPRRRGGENPRRRGGENPRRRGGENPRGRGEQGPGRRV